MGGAAVAGLLLAVPQSDEVGHYGQLGGGARAATVHTSCRIAIGVEGGYMPSKHIFALIFLCVFTVYVDLTELWVVVLSVKLLSIIKSHLKYDLMEIFSRASGIFEQN